jgi:tetratricopeptide (TPR) repeat protein
MRRPDEAVPVLEAAIRFNPVNPDPRFELAEAYKVMGQDEKLLTVIKETLPICATPYAISRCYANLGYYCVEVKDYENAVRFYFESLIYADHPAVPAELKHVAMLMGKKITPPTREEVLSAFAAYEIPNGPSQEVVGTATALANQAVEKHEWEEATFYLRVLSDLTHDPETKALLTKCQEQLKK